MKIGIYNPRVGIAEAGGTETFIRSIVPYLTKEHEITIYCGGGDFVDAFSELDVEVRPIPFNAKEDTTNSVLTRFSPALPAEVESTSMFVNAKRSNQFEHIEREMDVVSTHYYLDNLLVSNVVETPTVFHFPGLGHPSIRWKAMARFADPDCYLANSESTAERSKDWLNIETDGVVYPGIDLDQFTPDCEPAFHDDRFVVLYVGRLDTGKGLPDLIDAQPKLSDEIALYIVGEGKIKSQLKDQVNRKGINDSVSFLGAVSHEEIHRYYAASDVFCLPSYHEGFGMVNVEAMACGVPVISTSVDAVKEYITHEKNGILVEPGDVNSIANSIFRLQKSIDLREKLKLNGLETAKQFAWSNQAKKLQKYVKSVCQ